MCQKAAWRTKVYCHMWKFFKMKQHHWIITCSEVLISFLLALMIIQLADPSEYKNSKECHYAEDYLLSSGLSLWIQNEICRPSFECNKNGNLFNPICPYDNSHSLDCVIEWYSQKYSKIKKQDDAPKRFRQDICNNVVNARYEKGFMKLKPCQRHYFFKNIANNYILKRVLLGKVLYTPNDTRASRIIENAIEHNFGTFIKQKSKLNLSTHQEFAKVMHQFIECVAVGRHEGFNNKTTMLKKAQMLDGKGELLAAIFFHLSEASDDFPSFLNYTILVSTEINQETEHDFEYDYTGNMPAGEGTQTFDDKTSIESTHYSQLQPGNKAGLFLIVQDMIDYAFIILSSPRTNNTFSHGHGVSLRQMSQVCYEENKYDKEMVSLMVIVPASVVVLSFFLPFGVLVLQIVQEKEDQMKQFMLVISMKPHHYWAAWYFSSLIWWLLLFMPTYILLSTFIYDYVDISLVFFALLFFVMSCISQALLVSCFFTSVRIATLVPGLLYLMLTFFGFGIVFFFNNDVTISWDKLAYMSLIPQTGFIVGMRSCISETLSPGTGNMVTWSNLTFDKGGQHFCVMVIVLGIDTLLYILFTLYIDALFPGSYAAPKDWCFCLKSLLNKFKLSTGKQQHAKLDRTSYGTEHYSATGVELHGVTKTFNSQQGKLTAVSNVTLTFCPNEITILLGQNGAGKTTLFSLIVGTKQATSGNIYVEGKNVKTEFQEAREVIGFCPQTNTLFPDLTVSEHIWFFGTLKTGRYPTKIEMNQILSKTKFEEFKNVYAKDLSGGTKRKLSISIAFCGNTKVVLLDEPTSGVDPLSRRSIWNVLNEFKQGRTIIMSTHFMEEADEVGDKIAIIDLGILKAHDTPIFLKQKFAQFYKLVVASENHNTISMADQLIADIYGRNIKKHKHQDEMEYTLPNRSRHDSKKLIKVISSLEKHSNLDLGVKSSGIEDVFMAAIGIKHESEEPINQILRPSLTRRQARKRQLQHVYALLAKKIHCIKRDYWGFFSTFFFPTALILIVILPFYILFNKDEREPATYVGQEISPHIFHQFLHAKDVKNRCKDHIYQYAHSFSTMQLAFGESKVFNVKGQSIDHYFLDIDNSFRNKHRGLKISLTNYTKNSLQLNGSLSESAVRIWFDGTREISGPVYHNRINNIILKTHCSSNKSCGISTMFHPGLYMNDLQNRYSRNRPKAKKHKNKQNTKPRSKRKNSDFVFVLTLPSFLLITLSMVSTFWVMPYVHERLKRFKQLVYLEGLSPVTYWTTGLLAEYCLYIFYCTMLLLTMMALEIGPFVYKEYIGHVIVVLFLFGFANIAVTGLLSLFLSTGLQVFSAMMILMIIAVGFGEAGFFIRLSRKEVPSFIYLATILPHFCMFEGLNNIGYIATEGHRRNVNLNEWSHLGKLYLGMILIGVVAYVLLLLLECHKNKRKTCKSQNVQPSNKSYTREQGIALHVEQLKKQYAKSCMAVDGITFSVKHKTCFGLLGMNGAGKTTVLKLLTGEISPSSGKIIWKRKVAELGYCPQFDTHNPLLTPEELFTFHCRIHNYLENDIPHLVVNILKMLDLFGYKDIICNHLSGGTNRRISAGIAFLGAPQMVLLDEPSTGLDPVARKKIWDLVKRPAYSDQAFILVSHVMEECEALCDVIGIMDKGQFICKGTPQQLKNKFGNSYVVKINKLCIQSPFELLNWVQDNFPNTIVKEETISALKFSVSLDKVKLSKIFSILDTLEPVTTNSQVFCYTVSQATFNDVFLGFANKSTEIS